jgi:hypothetical protein
MKVTINKEYDIVITGGRVIYPETGLDAVRNVGIKGKANWEVFDVLIFDEVIEEEDCKTSSTVVLASGESQKIYQQERRNIL